MRLRSLVIAALVILATSDVRAETRTWTGTNGGSWSDPANWGGTAPVAGDALVFPEGPTNRAMTNDLASPFLVQSLVFQSTSGVYTLGGGGLTVGTGGITTAGPLGSARHVMSAPLVLSSGATPFAMTGWLEVSGPIDGPGGITKTGNSRLTLSGTNTYSGPTLVTAGYLEVHGSQPGSSITVNSSVATGGVWGTGTVGPVTVTAGSLNSSPGWPGTLTVAGDVTMTPAARMYPVVGNGATDAKLVATGAVALGGILTVVLNPTSAPGSVYTLVTADGGVTGTFNGVPEGGTVASSSTSSHRLRVSYVANGGRDVTVTDLGIDARLSLAASPAAPCPGESVTFTASVPRPSTSNPFATGNVVFRDGPAVLGTVALDSFGSASLATSSLSTGTHAITAEYPGDAFYSPGTASVGEGYDVGLLPSPFVVAPESLSAGGTGTASVAPTLGSGFAWTISNGTILSGDGTNQVTFTAGSSGETTLTAVVTNAGGCETKPGVAVVPIREFIEPQVVNRWRRIGPDGGPVYALVAAPSHPSTLWATTKAGAFRSTDGGAHWVKSWSSPNLPFGVAVHPTNSSYVLVADRYRQVFRSTDGGASWSWSSTGIPWMSSGSLYGQILFEPANPSVVYFAWPNGVFRSTDGGATWAPADSGAVNGKSVTSLAVHPSLPGHLYLAGAGGVFRSTDGGASWEPRSTGLPYQVSGTSATIPITAFAVDPDDWQTLFANAGADSRVYVSSDGGATWTARTAGAFRMISRSLLVLPGGGSTLYCGKTDNAGTNPSYLDRVYRSTDGGATWARVSEGLWSSESQPLAVVGSSPPTVYASIGGTLWKTEDGSGRWSRADGGLRGVDVGSAGSLVPGPPAAWLFHSDTRGLIRSTDDGASFQTVNQDIAEPVNGAPIVDPTDPLVFLAPGQTRSADYYTTHYFLVRSADGGATWSQVQDASGSGEPPVLQPWAFLAFPTTPTTFFVAGASEGVYKSTDAGLSFSARNAGLPAETAARAFYQGLAAADTVGNTLYLAVGNNATLSGVYKTTNGGDSWTMASTGLPAGASVRGVAVHPSAPQRVFASLSNQPPYRSVDAGATWTVIPGLPSGCLAVSVAPGNAETVYAAGLSSDKPWVSRSEDGGATWTPVTTSGLDLVSTWALSVDPGDPDRVVAVGRGGIATITLSADDSDGDGIRSSVEDQVPAPGGAGAGAGDPRPMAEGAGTGDGNGDGTPDADQSGVASLPGAVAGQWVTAAAPEGAFLSGVATMLPPVAGSLPPDSTLPSGAVGFSVGGLAPGACAAVTLFLPKETAIDGYLAYGPTPDDTAPHWYPFPFDGREGAEVYQDSDRTRVVLHLCDGRAGDGDLVADGSISSLGGSVAFSECTAPATPSPTNDGPKCEGGKIQLSVGHVEGASYRWVGPNGYSSDAELPTLAGVTPAMSGDYFVTVTVGQCTSAPGKTTVVVNPVPATPVITAPTTVAPEQTFTASVPVVADVTYTWIVTNGTLVSGDGTSELTVRAGTTGPVGVSIVETVVATGCTSGEASVSIPVSLPATRFYPLTPCRLFDTRNAAGPDAASPALAAGQTRTFTVGTRCGLTVATDRTLSVNVTVAGQTADGELALWRGDLATEPTTSAISFRAGKTRANNGLLELSRAGDGTFQVHNRSTGPVDFILDVNGVFR